MRTTPRWTLLATILLIAAPLFPADQEAEARELEVLFMAPCCGSTTLDLHMSGPAMEMKQEIRELLAAGKTRQEILDHFVAKHGNTILSMPEAKGFGLTAYLLPGLVLTALLILVWRRLSGQAATVDPEPVTAAPSPIDPEYRARLERELANY